LDDAEMKNRIDLAKYFASLGFTKGAEIGVADGRYSFILCKNIPGLELIAVDPFYRSGHEAKAHEILASFHTNIMKTTSMEAVLKVPDESLDFVFIDGDHHFDYVMEDIIGWTRKVRKGGIVSGHDFYNFHNSGVKEAVMTYAGIHEITLNIIPEDKTAYIDDQHPCWWFVK
jgi:predicted O-methyltransferase YrrM